MIKNDILSAERTKSLVNVLPKKDMVLTFHRNLKAERERKEVTSKLLDFDSLMMEDRQRGKE